LVHSSGDHQAGMNGSELDAPLLHCANCRNEITQDRLVYEVYERRLWRRGTCPRLRSTGCGRGSMPLTPPLRPCRRILTAAEKPGRRPAHWQGLAAASIVMMAVTIGLLAADRWTQFPRAQSAANYYTGHDSCAARAGRDGSRRFSPTITLVEVQAILDEAGLRIVAGPTEAGVYSLAADSRRPVSSSLATLRANAKVRFAESIQSGRGPDDSP